MKIVLFLIFGFLSCNLYAWDMGEVFSGMSANTTNPGSYQDQAAGYYSGGGVSLRTKKAGFQPFAATPPSMKMGCSGIDMYAGSFSIMSGQELVKMTKNLGAQSASYAFQLALKTFAPQIENLLSKLRDLAMELNEFSVEDCQLTQSLFASALSKDSAMHETVCRDLQRHGGGKDYFKARDDCDDAKKTKEKVKEAEKKDSELLLANYNLFIKAADKAKISRKIAESMMSLAGTIVMKDGRLSVYESLAKDDATWLTHLRGGDHAAIYTCEDDECLQVKLVQDQKIKESDSYQGKAIVKLEGMRYKLRENIAFSKDEIDFLSSIGDAFPIYDYISFEAISGQHLIDKSSYLVATYMILQYVKKIIQEVRQALYELESKQINDQHIKSYLNRLDTLQVYISEKYRDLMGVSVNMEKMLRHLEANQLAKVRG